MKLTIDRNGRSELLLIEEADNNDILPGTKYFRNFSGLEKKSKTGQVVNSEGRRNFCLALNFSKEVLDELAALGLDIVQFDSENTEEYGDEPLRFVRVQISEGGKAPSELYLVNETLKKKEPLRTGKQINLLDAARFSKVELVIRTWHKDNGKVSLYLNSGYFYIQMNPIDAKYANFDEAISDSELMADGEVLPWD